MRATLGMVALLMACHSGCSGSTVGGGGGGTGGAGAGGGAVGKSLFALTASDFVQRKDEALVSGSASGSCTQVQKGDILYFTANGSLDTTLGTVGPDGSDGWGGMIFVLVNRPAFGLFGALDTSRFLIGRELALIAPRSGCLTTLVNGCNPEPAFDAAWINFDCSTTGPGFQSTTYSQLASGVTIASEPPLTDDSIASSSTVSVDAAQGWQPTGVQLHKGQKVFVSATGSITTTMPPDGSASGTLDADGADGLLGGIAFLLTNRMAWRLFGQVGGNVVDVGKSGVFLAPAAGELELAVNHFTGKDSGSLSVTVGQGVVPARGLLEADRLALTQSATVTVAADGRWVGSGVHVHKGDPVVLSATGQVTGTSLEAGPVGPNGEGSIGGYAYPLGGRPLYALFGRVGSEVFFLGDQNVVLAPDDGEVQLIVNQSTWCTDGCADSGFDAGAGADCIPPSFCDVHGSYSATLSAP